MRLLLVLIVPLLIVGSGDVDARKKRHRHRQKAETVIVVEDYTTEGWAFIVGETVQDFQALGVPLRYEDKTPTPCTDITPSERWRLVICSSPDLYFNGQEVAETAERSVHRLRTTTVVLSDRYLDGWYDQFREATVCHGLMHALTGIGDNFGALPTESCVWGGLSDPGPFDVAKLAEVFGAYHR